MTISNQRAFEVCLPMIAIEPHNDFIETLPAESFQKIVLEAVDETLSLFGEKAKKSIYSKLKEDFGITKQDIPIEVEKFIAALEEIVGPGAKLLEIEMMKRLYKKIGPNFKYSPRQKNLTFAEYLTATRVFLSMQSSARKPMPNEYYEYKFC